MSQHPISPKIAPQETPSVNSHVQAQSAFSKRPISRITTACESCKQRKTKCSGPPAPCHSCQRYDTECVFDQSFDHRRKQWIQRSIEATAAQTRLLIAIMQILRFDDKESERLLEAIRQDHPSEDIITLIRSSAATLEGRSSIATKIDELHDEFIKQESAFSETPQKFNIRENEPSGDDARPLPTRHDPEPAEPAEPKNVKLQSDAVERLRTYERWIQVIGSQLDIEADIRMEGVEKDREHSTTAEPGLWRKLSNPDTSEHDLYQGKRATLQQKRKDSSDSAHLRDGWHFALQIRDEEDAHQGNTYFHLVEDPELEALTSLVQAQESGYSTGYIEILHGIPKVRREGVPGPYYLDFQRYPLFSVQPLTAIENSPISRVITDYRDAARTLIADGYAPIDILGHDGIDVALFFRDRVIGDEYTISNWASEVWRSFHEWDIYVRLALVLTFTYVMRWMLVPTAKRFADIPNIVKPLPIQYLVAHHIALDFLPLPPLREALIKSPRDWMTALPLAKLSVNWNGGLDGAVVWDDQFQCWRLSEEFEKHVTKYENWSVGESLLSMFPELQGAVQFSAGH